MKLSWALVALGALAGSCGYSTGLTVPSGIHSVGVEVFGNDGRMRDMELDMQYALSDSVFRSKSFATRSAPAAAGISPYSWRRPEHRQFPAK